MTAFEKSLRALDEEAVRTGTEELLTLLEEADGVRPERRDSRGDGGQKRRDSAAAHVSALIAAGISPEKGGGETETASGGDASASDEARPETAKTHRAYPETDGGGPAADKTTREDDETLPETAFPEATAGKDRGERKKRRIREDREAQKVQDDREDREGPESRNDREERRGREDREEPENPIQTHRAQDGETVDRAEAQALEERLQSVSDQRRGRARQSGEDEGNGVHTAAFRGPERQYEGAVGARGMEMRRISDYFRRDSRRYDTGFTTY